MKIPCYYCGQMISDTEQNCPYCGDANRNVKRGADNIHSPSSRDSDWKNDWDSDYDWDDSYDWDSSLDDWDSDS